jgi:hypothetical protein
LPTRKVPRREPRREHARPDGVPGTVDVVTAALPAWLREEFSGRCGQLRPQRPLLSVGLACAEGRHDRFPCHLLSEVPSTVGRVCQPAKIGMANARQRSLASTRCAIRSAHHPSSDALCGRGDSNSHPRGDRDLNPARLPISPRPHAVLRGYRTARGSPMRDVASDATLPDGDDQTSHGR